jgi:hypothetical protein
MKPLIRLDSYRVSERVVLRKGTRFRATGGPLFRMANGDEVKLGAKGPFTFLAYTKRGAAEVIEALDRDGAFVPMHIRGRRRKVTAEIVTQPYRIKGTIRKKQPRRK